MTGTTNWRFDQVHDTTELDDALQRLDRDDYITLACINDDQDDKVAEGFKEKFDAWIDRHWGEVEAAWEKQE